MELDVVYFYIVAIVNWQHLLKTEKFKWIILNSLIHLVEKEKLVVYGFVIMPHIHIIWENKAINGKELPTESFMKFTGHAFLQELRRTNDPFLERFKVDRYSRKHQFWPREGCRSLCLTGKYWCRSWSISIIIPCRKHWNLVTDPNDYYFSSSSFYELGDLKYKWPTHYADVF